MTKSKIPMSPEERPDQNSSSGIVIPDCPDYFLNSCSHFIDDDNKKRAPRNAVFLGSVEWAWSPFHSRIDNYYLSSRKPYWLLWNHWLDDNDGGYPWYWTIYNQGLKKNVDMKTAAIHLIMDTWQYDQVDHFHWVNNEGLLSADEFYAMGKIVWSGKNREV